MAATPIHYHSGRNGPLYNDKNDADSQGVA